MTVLYQARTGLHSNGILSAKAAKIPVPIAPSWYTSCDNVSKSDWLVEDLTDPLIAQLLGIQLATI
jgi:hypothetical protein